MYTTVHGAPFAHIYGRVSQDISNNIIDIVGLERSPEATHTLRSCTLVCRDWLLRPRVHLFSTIRLKPRTDFGSLNAIIDEGRLSSHVRDVEITGCLMPAAWGKDSGTGLHPDSLQPDHTWLMGAISFLRRLKRVRTLRLVDLSWGDVPLEVRSIMLSQFISVTDLRLHVVDFWNSNQLIRTLNAFPHLESLTTDRLSYHKGSHTVSQIRETQPLHLDFLDLRKTDCARYGPLLHWLMGQREALTVDEARIHWDDPCLESLITLLRVVAPSLRSLNFELSSRGGASVERGSPLVPVKACQGSTLSSMGSVISEVTKENDFDDPEEDDFQDSAVNVPLDLSDDVPGTESRFDEEYEAFLSDVYANAASLSALHESPITDSSMEYIATTIQWSSLAPFALTMLSQLVSEKTRIFAVQLLLPSLPDWWDIDWKTMDSALVEAGHCSDNDRRKQFSLNIVLPQSMSAVFDSIEILRRQLCGTFACGSYEIFVKHSRDYVQGLGQTTTVNPSGFQGNLDLVQHQQLCATRGLLCHRLPPILRTSSECFSKNA